VLRFFSIGDCTGQCPVHRAGAKVHAGKEMQRCRSGAEQVQSIS